HPLFKLWISFFQKACQLPLRRGTKQWHQDTVDSQKDDAGTEYDASPENCAIGKIALCQQISEGQRGQQHKKQKPRSSSGQAFHLQSFFDGCESVSESSFHCSDSRKRRSNLHSLTICLRSYAGAVLRVRVLLATIDSTRKITAARSSTSHQSDLPDALLSNVSCVPPSLLT